MSFSYAAHHELLLYCYSQPLSYALLCVAFLCFALLCFALLCFALLCFCFALRCFALLCCAVFEDTRNRTYKHKQSHGSRCRQHTVSTPTALLGEITKWGPKQDNLFLSNSLGARTKNRRTLHGNTKNNTQCVLLFPPNVCDQIPPENLVTRSGSPGRHIALLALLALLALAGHRPPGCLPRKTVINILHGCVALTYDFML